jgi:hypothetical protein
MRSPCAKLVTGSEWSGCRLQGLQASLTHDSPVTLAASVSARNNAAGLVAQTPKGWVTHQAGALQGAQLQRAVPISCTNL